MQIYDLKSTILGEKEQDSSDKDCSDVDTRVLKMYYL